MLAEFAVDTASDAIPATLRASGTRHVVDVVGCGLAAVAVGVASHATELASSQGGAPQASVFGEPTRAPASVAALANGARCHALDFDDTHEAGICHASAVVLPAALAVGEARKRTGAEVLDAYLIGCEVALRVAVAAADGLYHRGFHPTGVCGAFGAAAAAARLLDLAAPVTTRALGVVGSFAAGLLEFLSDGSATKPLHAGAAARAGVDAALLAAAGAEGPASVLEGRFGLLASHTDGAPDADAMSDGLGVRWQAADLAIKPFPACHFAHSSTWAANELAREHGLEPAHIDEIVVRIPAEGLPLVLEPIAEKVAPRSAYDAKFSLPYTLSHHLLHGELGLSAFEPERICDSATLELASRVRHEPIADRDGRHSRFGGGVRILTAAGHEYDRFVPDAPGSPSNPLDDRAVVSKFHANAGLALEPAASTSLAEALLELSSSSALDTVSALVRDARPRSVLSS